MNNLSNDENIFDHTINVHYLFLIGQKNSMFTYMHQITLLEQCKLKILMTQLINQFIMSTNS